MIKLKNLLRQEKIQKQIYKLLLTLIVCLFFLIIVEFLFKIPYIQNAFSRNILKNNIEDLEKFVQTIQIVM